MSILLSVGEVARFEVDATRAQNDGPSASLTAPNGSAQRRLIIAVQNSLVTQNKRGALEAHGTGTALGDPVEVGAATGALCEAGIDVSCTSLKANMGHLEAVAGGAGAAALLCLSLSLRGVAANAQTRNLNPHLVTVV